MAQHDQLYQRALYYDIALKRDVSRETDFLLDAFGRHGSGPLRSVVEVACGPGYHAKALAGRGLTVVGLDLYQQMLELAAEGCRGAEAGIRWLTADMRSFELDQPADLAICMFDGIDALLDDADYAQHFATVAANLRPGGLYIVDCTHPRDCSARHYGDYTYRGQRDGTSVEIVWATNQPRIDPVTGVAEVELEMRIRKDGQTTVIKDRARERCLTPPELRLLAGRSGLEAVAWYGDYSLDQPLDNSALSHRSIAVLHKPEQRHG